MVRDDECNSKGLLLLKEMLHSSDQQARMSEACRKMGVRGAADKIAEQISKVVNNEPNQSQGPIDPVDKIFNFSS